MKQHRIHVNQIKSNHCDKTMYNSVSELANMSYGFKVAKLKMQHVSKLSSSSYGWGWKLTEMSAPSYCQLLSGKTGDWTWFLSPSVNIQDKLEPHIGKKRRYIMCEQKIFRRAGAFAVPSESTLLSHVNAASHQDLHCLPLIQLFSDTTVGWKLYLFKF